MAHRLSLRGGTWAALAGALVLWTQAAAASCLNVAGAPLRYASLDVATDARSGAMRLTYLGHASFEIESPEGARAVTDYNGYLRPERLPDVVTMNNSHRGHYTTEIDPAIRHALRGWSTEGVARYDIMVKDLHVRNVPTNLSEWNGKLTNGNSIFVFEAQGVCVAHISHVHHALSEDQVRELGTVDVALVAVDGAVTMSHEELFEALDKLKPRLIIPMHFVQFGSLGRFIAIAEPHYPVKHSDGDTITVGTGSLPEKPEVLVLRARIGG